MLPEIPEGELTLQQLNNYTKNPLLVRVFHELAWVEDMGSGTRNIMRYAPLYYPNYKVEISNGTQFIFSITYMGLSQENGQMSQETDGNVLRNQEMPQEKVIGNRQMSQENFIELDDEDFKISLTDNVYSKKNLSKKRKRQQGVMGLIKKNPNITMEEMADVFDVDPRTIHRDIEDLKNVVEHVGPTKGGYWKLIKGENN